MTTKNRRGFALLMVVAVAAGAMAIALSLTKVSGSNADVAHRSAGSLEAATYARTGLERATAYAMQMSTASGGDFDLVLDPLEEADCTMMDPGGLDQPFNFATNMGPGNWILRPRFTEPQASMLNWPAGTHLWWRLVPSGEGAYMVRFEDDGDDDCDEDASDALRFYTSNHPAGGCLEGYHLPAAVLPDQPGYNSAVNPVRDMNRAIWVISVGIFPGTDPDAARFRITERRLVNNVSVNASNDDFVIDEMHGEDTSNVILNSPTAIPRTNRMHVDDTSDWEYCTAASADWDLSGGSSAAATNCGPLPLDRVDLTSTFVPPVIPAWNNKQWMDFGSPCNFYIRNFNGGGDPEGLWFWNVGGTWGAGGVNQCADASDFASIPAPVLAGGPVTNPDDPDSCWVPIMVSPNGPPGMYDPCEFQQARDVATDTPLPVHNDVGGVYGHAAGAVAGQEPARWFPIDADTQASVTASATCSGYYSPGLHSGRPTLPDMLSNCGGGVDLGGLGTTYGACDGCTAGTPEWAYEYRNAPNTHQWLFRRSGAGSHYIPNGLVIYDGNHIMTSGDNWDGTEPPMITVLMRGNLRLSNSADLAFGSGGQPNGAAATSTLAYPGLVLYGNATPLLQNNGTTLEVWGAFHAVNNIRLNDPSTLRVRGPLVTSGDIRTEDGSTLDWDYPASFLGSVISPASSGVRLSYPIRF